MYRRRLVGLLLTACFTGPSAWAQEQSSPTHITFEQAMRRARQRGPELVVARAGIAEARGGLETAGIARFNPQLQGSAGPRFGPSQTTVDWSIGARQWLEIGGQPSGRVRAARAGLEAAKARSDDVERRLLRDVGLVFVRALYDQRRLELATENLRIAQETLRVAERRKDVGESGGLETAIASLSFARAEAAEARVRVDLAQVVDRLGILLGHGANTELVAQGDLRKLGLPLPAPPSARDARADLRWLHAEIRRADADAEVGLAQRVPNIAVGAVYAREEQADIVRGSLAISLPLIDHGQRETRLARARRARIEIELGATRRRAALEVKSAHGASRALSAAARRFEARGLGTLARSQMVAQASYEAGAIPLADLLTVRRELVQAKLEYEDLLLAAAMARLEFLASTGAI